MSTPNQPPPRRRQRFVYFPDPQSPRPQRPSREPDRQGEPTLDELFAYVESPPRRHLSPVEQEIRLALAELRAMTDEARTSLRRIRAQVRAWTEGASLRRRELVGRIVSSSAAARGAIRAAKARARIDGASLRRPQWVGRIVSLSAAAPGAIRARTRAWIVGASLRRRQWVGHIVMLSAVAGGVIRDVVRGSRVRVQVRTAAPPSFARFRRTGREARRRLAPAGRALGRRAAGLIVGWRRFVDKRLVHRFAWNSAGTRWLAVALLAGGWALAAPYNRAKDDNHAAQSAALAAAPVVEPLEQLARTWVQAVIARAKDLHLADLAEVADLAEASVSAASPAETEPEPKPETSRERAAPRRITRQQAPQAPAADAPSQQARYRGTLVVSSTPEGARVSVDGVERGTAPVAIRRLDIGSHVVRVDLPGYQTWSWSVHVPANRRTHLRVDLVPTPGTAVRESP